MTIELTQQEAQQLLQLIDIAQKQLGLQASEVCLRLATKITEASKPVIHDDEEEDAA